MRISDEQIADWIAGHGPIHGSLHDAMVDLQETRRALTDRTRERDEALAKLAALLAASSRGALEE